MTDALFTALCARTQDDSATLRTLQITDSELADLTREQADTLVELFGANTLMHLPAREVEFFEWLRDNDPSVWQDLWGEDGPAYLISIAFLPDLLPKGRGFLICDLTSHQNFNFAVGNITPEEGTGLLGAAIDVVRAQGRLQLHQAFLVEVWRGPIDLWRFAWMYNVSLDVVKEMVVWLISEGALSLPTAESSDAVYDAPTEVEE